MPLACRRRRWSGRVHVPAAWAFITVVAFLGAGQGYAQVARGWGDVALISPTIGNDTGRVCIGDTDVDMGCPTYAPYLTSGGLLGIGTTNPQTALEVSGTVSATHFVGDGSGLIGLPVADLYTLVHVSASTAMGNLFAGTVTGAMPSVGYSTAFGMDALASASNTGYFNAAFGFGALRSNTGGMYNLAVGGNALASNTTGIFNTAVGGYALYKSISGLGNTAIGSISLGFNTVGNWNTAIGGQSGADITTGSYNIIIGTQNNIGTGITTGDNNIIIGSDVHSGLSRTGSNQLNIGNLIFGAGLTKGSYLSSGTIGIGTVKPTTALEVSGTVSATHFVGDGSGLTGVVASTADRIVSGTTSLLAVSSTGYVSLTQAGANTGWFDPTRGLVTLGVSATGPVSGTAGYFSGNVGIGTTSPYAPIAGTFLEVSGTSGFVSVRGTSATGKVEVDFDNSSGVQGAIGWGNSGSALANRLYLGTVGANPVVFLTSATERLRVDSSGNVGIGTSAPAATLQVAGSLIVSTTGQNTTPSLYVSTAGSIGMGTNSPTEQLTLKGTGPNIGLYDTTSGATDTIQNSSGGLIFNTGGGNSIIFQLGGSEKMRVNTSTGNVGINTTNPNAALDVNGGISGTTGYFSGNLTVKGATLALGATATSISIMTSADVSSLNPGSSNLATVMQGPLNTHLIFDLRNNNTNDAIAFRYSAAGNTTVDTVGLVFRGDGNVGIGTINPSSRLEISGPSPASASAAGQLTVSGAETTGAIDTGSSLTFAGHDGTAGRTWATIQGLKENATVGNYAAYLRFTTRPSGTIAQERMRIDSTGYVGIGTTSPNAKLEVNGTVSATNIQAAGTLKVGVYSSQPVACGASYKGMIAMTSAGHICACDGSGWKDVGASYAACSW